MENVIDEFGRQQMQNPILEMIQNELQLDFNYQAATNNILVRINQNTINNPVLRDW